MPIAVIDIEHLRGHNGDMYSYSDQDSVASGAAINHALQTFEDETHLRFSFAAAQIATVSLIENAVLTGGTIDDARIFNRNRNCGKTAGAHVWDNALYTGGTVIFVEQRGAPTAAAQVAPFVYDGLPRAATEWILMPNTLYILRVVNNDNSTSTISTQMNWYEFSD